MPIQISWQGATLGANTFTGAQVAPSLALGGATIGSDALAVTGSASFSSNVTSAAAVQAGATSFFGFSGNNTIRSRSSGVMTLGNYAENDFGRLQFGGTTSSYPSIKRNATALNFRLADDSADAPITAANLALGGATIGTYALNVIGTALFSSNFQVNSTISALALGNTGTSANSLIEMLAGGTRISRNVADALSALTVKQTNASSTGNIIDGVNSAGTVFSVSQSGAISVGNTVNSVIPTLPNRTVTMVIGGTTYYLAAKTTND